MDFSFAQGIGLVAAAVGIGRLQCKTREGLLIGGSLSKYLFVAHYWLMNAQFGALIALVAATRGLVMLFPWALKRRFYVALASVVLGGVVFFSGMVDVYQLSSIFVVLSFLLATIADLQQGAKLMRVLSVVSLAMWFVFAALTGSYGGMLSTSFAVASGLIGMYRYRASTSKIAQ